MNNVSVTTVIMNTTLLASVTIGLGVKRTVGIILNMSVYMLSLICVHVYIYGPPFLPLLYK